MTLSKHMQEALRVVTYHSWRFGSCSCANRLSCRALEHRGLMRRHPQGDYELTRQGMIEAAKISPGCRRIVEKMGVMKGLPRRR